MLKIVFNPNYKNERLYVCKILMRIFLGIEYTIDYEDRKNVCIEYRKKKIVIDDSFFQQESEDYLRLQSLPEQPLARIEIPQYLNLFIGEELPIIYGTALKDEEYIEVTEDIVNIGLDIFGSVFFMLTRYEEIVKKERDEHGRFCAKDSLAYQEGFLERPIVNEYLELLWWAIHRLWPELKRKRRQFKIMPTHDVDSVVAMANLSWCQRLREIAGDFMKRRDVAHGWHNIKLLFNIHPGDYRAEWKETFAHIMDLSEKNNLTSTFFFMTQRGLSKIDGNYDVFGKEATDLAELINIRGHRIGLHPSYESFKNEQVITNNASELRTMLNARGIKSKGMGARQHYLRWEAAETWRHYEEAGLKYDSTLCFADHIGFRCGVCYEYPVFDVVNRRELDVWEYPLVVMDCTFWDYMKLNYADMRRRAIALKYLCKKYKGNFVILWHNETFLNDKREELYRAIICD